MMVVNQKLCEACGTCVGVCPADAIKIEWECAIIDPVKCRSCRACEFVCPVKAIENDVAVKK